MSTPTEHPPRAARGHRLLRHAIPWLITIACFSFLYHRISAHTPEGRGVVAHLASIFASIDWVVWLGLMIPYSIFYLLVDTAVLTRVVSWFNKPVSYGELLPIRASAYIITIVNEQVGKGAIGWYLNRRHGVPGWQVASSLVLIALCEPLYLLAWATVGIRGMWDRVPAVFHWIPAFALGAVVLVSALIVFFRSSRFEGVALRDKQLFHAFRRARPWQYLTILALRSPALLAGVVVYSRAAHLFGVEIPIADMLGFLPMVFFGTFVPGPFRSVAVAIWPLLYPSYTAEMTAFGFVMHNFFVLFNAAIGLLFLPRANRELALAR